MASNGRQPRSTTTSTTTTSTLTTVTSNRRPRSSSNSIDPSVSTLNRMSPPPAIRVSPSTSRVSNTNVNSTEPFPRLQLEPSRISQLSQTRSIDHRPLTHSVTAVSQRPPSNSISTQVKRRPIGIKRLSSHNVRPESPSVHIVQPSAGISETGRRRSTSAPQRPTRLEFAQDNENSRHLTGSSRLPALFEGQISSTQDGIEERGHELQERSGESEDLGITRSRGGSQRLRRVSDAARSAVSRLSNRSEDTKQPPPEYSDEIVDVLDVLDPEVSTLTTLTNVQNSLFVPDLGRWLNRRPTFQLTQGPSYRNQRPTLNRGNSKPLPPSPVPGPPPLKNVDIGIPSDIEEEAESPIRDHRPSSASARSITSVVQEEHYAVLPHGVSLDGWSEEDKELLDDHVRHMLHSKREGFKRSMRAFGKYVSKPLGFFVTLYAVLITLFGLAWVLFLIGWIYVGERQLYAINVIDNVLVALFAIMGDGLAPFRAVDTYHMAFIAHYHHLTEKLRKKRDLPKLQDKNELPEVHESEVDVEASVEEGEEFSVLTPEQQKKLQHHQEKFSKSHSFYKPHETTTHWAFPHHLFVAIVILLDMHSCLQIALGSCTWGINYLVRPKALTPTILSCSITVNITAGILIKVGDNKTRKKDVLERMFRQQLTEEAMKRVDQESSDEKASHKRRLRDRKQQQQQQDEKKILEDRIDEDSEDNRLSTGTEEYVAEPPPKSRV